MDIIRHCAEQPNIHVRTLLSSRKLNDYQLNHFLILACARLIRTYVTHRHEPCATASGEPDSALLLREMNIPVLAARVDLDITFTTRVVRELAPDVIAQLRKVFGQEHSLLSLFDDDDAA